MTRLIITYIAILLMSGPALAQKAGVGAWENPRYTTLKWIEDVPELGWYYNWRPDQMHSLSHQKRTVEFVPMIHSANDVNKKIISKLPIKNLLGFNEPDGDSGSHQANLSVQEAIRLWPELEDRGLRLGSPATTRDQTLGRSSWQRRFMNQVDKKGLRVDFMAVHYYSTNGSVAEFQQWLEAVHAEYSKPIWVTEFAFIDWQRPHAASHDQNAEFAEQSILMMEKLPFIERHSWFSANPYPWNGRAPAINLIDDNLVPTSVGQAFNRVLSRIGSEQISSASFPDTRSYRDFWKPISD